MNIFVYIFHIYKANIYIKCRCVRARARVGIHVFKTYYLNKMSD